MGWKRISIQRVYSPFPENKTKNSMSPDEEAEVRSVHSELLEHEKNYIKTRSNLAVALDKIKATSRPIFGFSSGGGIEGFIRSALGNLRTSIPRLDWQTHCQACGRPHDQNEFELETISVPRPSATTPRVEPTKENFDEIQKAKKEHKETTQLFESKRSEFAELLRRIGVTKSAILFNRTPSSLGQWIEYNMANYRGRVRVHGLPTSENNCPNCKRSLDGKNSFLEIVRALDRKPS